MLKLEIFPVAKIDPTAILKVPVYKTLHECLKNEKIDAVHICVHTDLHYEIATEAMKVVYTFSWKNQFAFAWKKAGC